MKDAVKKTFKSPVRSFIVLASIFGLLSICLMPPFTGADEEAHFVRAYGISEGSIVLNQDGSVMMPTAYRKTLGCLQTKQPIPGELYTYTYGEYGSQKQETLRCALSIRHNDRDKEPIITTASGYSPATYVPQTISIGMGKIFDAPIIIMSYMARLVVLVSYIVLMGIAIKILPSRKWALVGLALLPHSIIHVTNPGADYMLLGATAIFIAAIIRSTLPDALESKVSSRKLIAITVVAAMSMVFTKGIFPGICFLPLLLFFGGLRKQLVAKIAIILTICVAGLVWQQTVLITSNLGTNSLYEFPHAFVKTMFYEWSNTDFVFRYLGLGLGNKVGMPAVAITLMNMLLALYIFTEYSKVEIKQRVSNTEVRLMAGAGIVIATIVVVAYFAALYIAAPSLQDGSNIIRGVQARYFYPALLLLAIIPYKRAIFTSQHFYKWSVIIGSTLLLVTQAVAIAVRYY